MQFFLDLQRQLGIDASFFTQLVVFLVIFAWLQAVYFKPYLALIQRRKAESGGVSDSAVKMEEEAGRAELEYRTTLANARRKAAAERERVLAEAHKQANDLVGAARAEAKTKLEHARAGAQQSAEVELSNLRGQVAPISAMLVEKLTNIKVGL